MKPRAATLCTLLPPQFAERLANAAASRDHHEIDRITDQLALAYPKLVRQRAEVGGFKSVADEKRRQA